MYEICLKSLIKDTRTTSSEILWAFDLKVFNADFDMVFVFLHYFFVGKFLHFEKNTGIYRRLHNINLRKLF